MSTLVTRAGESAVTRAIFLFESLLIGIAVMVFCGQQFGLRIMLTDSAAPVGIYRSIGFKFGSWHDVGWWQRQLLPPVGEETCRPFTSVGVCSFAIYLKFS